MIGICVRDEFGLGLNYVQVGNETLLRFDFSDSDSCRQFVGFI